MPSLDGRVAIAKGRGLGKTHVHPLMLLAMQSLERVLFEDSSGAAEQTVQGLFRACSYGKANFSRDSSRLTAAGVVPIPCNGRTPQGEEYNSSTCAYHGRKGLVLAAGIPSKGGHSVEGLSGQHFPLHVHAA